jgi:hypothetical protein
VTDKKYSLSDATVEDSLPNGEIVPDGYVRIYNDGPGDVRVELMPDEKYVEIMRQVGEPYMWPDVETYVIKAGLMDERFPKYPVIDVVKLASLNLESRCRVYKGTKSFKCRHCGEWSAKEFIKRNGSARHACPKCGQSIV